MVHATVLSRPSSSPPSPPSSPEQFSSVDDQISSAICAWLVAQHRAESGQSFIEATNQCVSLCQLFHSFAPEYLSDRDFFSSNATGANVTRHRRYNTRRLARSLTTYFGISVRAPSPNGKEHSPNTPILNDSVVSCIRDIADGDHPDDAQSPRATLLLAEVLLCAAVHSEQRESFIGNVLSLHPQYQQALQKSIKRTIVEDRKAEVLSPTKCNNENILTENMNNSVSQGIPLSDYKALAAERDALRKKLAAAEFERNRAVNATDDLRSNLEQTTDKLREMQVSQDKLDAELQTKTNALNDTRAQLRDFQLNQEEIDMLRAKAASAEQLEQSLKRASKRLEAVADMRKGITDLETQVSAFRENEQRMVKHTEYLEMQLKSSSDRSKQLVMLSDNLSAEVDKKERQIEDLNGKNEELVKQLEAANKQLTTMLLQSTNTISQSKDNITVSLKPQTEIPERISEKEGDNHEPLQRKSSVKCMEQSEAVPHEALSSEELKELMSELLLEETGCRLQWNDIVECVKGVMDAMKEMGMNNMPQDDYPMPQEEVAYDALGQPVPLHSSQSQLDSEYSVQSGQSDLGSDSETRMSLLPEFSEHDMKMKHENGGRGDEFDFAVNGCNANVREVHVPDAERAGVIQKRSDTTEDISEREDSTRYPSPNGSPPVYSQASSSSNLLAIVEGSQDRNVQRNTESGAESPYLGYEIANSKRKQSPVEVIPKDARRSRSSTQNVRRAASVTVSLRSGISRQQSETTRSLVRQARVELAALQTTIEMMRVERQQSSSLHALVVQLDKARHDVAVCEDRLRESESKCETYRSELNELIREVDIMAREKENEGEKADRLLKEKERVLSHLMGSLKSKEEELEGSKKDNRRFKEQVEKLRASERALEEKLRAASVIEKAHEVEIARLTAKLDATDCIASRLTAVVKQTDGLHFQMSTEKEAHLQEIAAAARREKELAERARDEAKKVAEKQVSVLEDVRSAAAMAVKERNSRPNDTIYIQRLQSRKSVRFSDFWRRLLHRERPIDYTMPETNKSKSTPATAATA